MNESVVFGNNPNASPPVEPASSQTPQEASTQPEAPQTDAGQVAEQPTFAVDNGGSSKKRLLFIILGIVGVIIITLLIIFLIPRGGSAQKVTLVWWGLWEDARIVTPLIEQFEKEHPNIHVTYIKQNPEQYRSRLATRISNGSGPDIFRYHNTWYPMLGEYLLPFSDDVISADEFTKQFYPVMQTDLVHNGAIYGIPLEADTLSLFANTDILEAAGETVPTRWDDFCKVATKVTVTDPTGKIKTAGAALGLYNNITHAPDIVSLLLAQQGVTMENITTSSQGVTDALAFYTAFAKGGSECPAQKLWDSTLDESILAFSKGNLALYFGYSWDIFEIQKLNKDLTFTVNPVPALVDRNQTIASYWVEGVSRKSLHQKEALLFMKYLAQKSTSQVFYTNAAKVRSFGEPYARADLTPLLKENKLVAPFVEQLPNAQSSYFVSNTHDGDGGLNFLLNNYLSGAIDQIVNSSSLDSSVRTLMDGISQVYTKYGLIK